MGLCKDCRHWTRSTEYGEPKFWGECSHPKVEILRGDWHQGEREPDGLMHEYDDPYCIACLFFGENFGCVHFTPLAQS